MCQRHMDFAFLIEIRRRDPLMQPECRARGIENGTALDDPQPIRQPQPQAFEQYSAPVSASGVPLPLRVTVPRDRRVRRIMLSSCAIDSPSKL